MIVNKILNSLVNLAISRKSYGKNIRLKHLKFNLPRDSFDKAVELGCGKGYLLHNINAKKKIGYDIDPTKTFSDIEYHREKAEDFDEEGVELLICSEVIEHVENDELVLRKIGQSIARKGVLFLTTINKNTAVDKSDKDKRRGHIRRYGRRELEGKINSVGIKTTSLYPIRSNHYYQNKGNVSEYDMREDIRQGQINASGWVYIGNKK